MSKTLPGLRCLMTRKRAKMMTKVMRAVGQLPKNMAPTERIHPNKLNHLLKKRKVGLHPNG